MTTKPGPNSQISFLSRRRARRIRFAALAVLLLTGLGIVGPVVQSINSEQSANIASIPPLLQENTTLGSTSPGQSPSSISLETGRFETQIALGGTPEPVTVSEPTEYEALNGIYPGVAAGTDALINAPVPSDEGVVEQVVEPDLPIPDVDGAPTFGPASTSVTRLVDPVATPAGDIEAARAAYGLYRSALMPEGDLIPVDLISLVTAAFPSSEWGAALAVSWCESRWGGDPLAFAEGHPDAGWFQINRYWHEDRARGHGWTWEQVRFDMVINVAMALEIFGESGWDAWTCSSVLA